MKFFLDNWLLFGLLAGSGAALLMPLIRQSGTGLTPAQAVQLMNREKAFVVDVCETEEFASAHVGQARNVPLGEFESRIGEVAKNKALPLLLLCPSGARARRAAAVAKKLGYARVEVVVGGTRAWREAGLPVEKSA